MKTVQTRLSVAWTETVRAGRRYGTVVRAKVTAVRLIISDPTGQVVFGMSERKSYLVELIDADNPNEVD